MIGKSLIDSSIVTVLILKSHPKPCLRQAFVHLSVLSNVGKPLATSESLTHLPHTGIETGQSFAKFPTIKICVDTCTRYGSG